jgi:hypothetical protein
MDAFFVFGIAHLFKDLGRGFSHRPLVLSSLYEDVRIATMKRTKVVITSQNVDDMIRTSSRLFLLYPNTGQKETNKM